MQSAGGGARFPVLEALVSGEGAEDLRARRTMGWRAGGIQRGLEAEKGKNRDTKDLSIFLCSHKRCKDPEQH